MLPMLPAQDLLGPVDGASRIKLRRVPEDQRATISRYDQVAIPSDTLTATLMTELNTTTFRLRNDLDCRAVQGNADSR